MTCQTCINWNPKASGQMAQHRLCVCNIQPSKAVFFPPHHTCSAHKPAAQMVVEKRAVWVGKYGKGNE